MATTTTLGGRSPAVRALVFFAIVATLIVAILGAALLTGAIRPTAPTLEPAGNGRIFASDGLRIRSFAQDGTDAKVLATFSNAVAGLSLSPDGRRAATVIADSPARIVIVDLDSGQATDVPLPTPMEVGGIRWSPDGASIMFPTFDGTVEHLFIAPTDGSVANEIHPDTIPAGQSYFPVGWSPSGDRIAFVSGPGGGESGNLYVATPTGTDVQQIVPEVVIGDSASWSPDPSLERLVYTADGNTVKIVDASAPGKSTTVHGGFWPTWSPDGRRLAYWNDGTIIIPTADALAGTSGGVRPYPAWTGYCQDHPELAGKSFCGPAIWSPDGTRVIAPDIVGDQLLSVRSDGSGGAILVPLDANSLNELEKVVWRPAS